jgi:site-specific recombinase XerD
MTLLSYLQNNYSKTGVYNNGLIIKRYLQAMGKQAATANYAAVLGYVGLLRAQNLHPKTVRNNLFGIKIYYNYLVATGKRADHPCKYLKLKDPINRAIKVGELYSEVQLGALLVAIKKKKQQHALRNELIVGLLVYQGLRVQEITALRLRDVNLEAGTVMVGSTGQTRSRTLSLRGNQILPMQQYIMQVRAVIVSKTQSKNESLILTKAGNKIFGGIINKLINYEPTKQLRAGSGVIKLTPLKIRQSVLTNLLKQNNDVRIVQEFAGHKRTSSTEGYQQKWLGDLSRNINKYHPLQ